MYEKLRPYARKITSVCKKNYIREKISLHTEENLATYGRNFTHPFLAIFAPVVLQSFFSKNNSLISRMHFFLKVYVAQIYLCMRYKFIERANPLDKDAPKKLYAAPVYNGKIDKKQIADDLVLISSLSRGDISSVIENLLDSIPKYLLRGYSVQLGDLGTLRISFSSEGVDDPDSFHVGMIRGKKILFTPGPAFKKILADLVYDKEKDKK